MRRLSSVLVLLLALVITLVTSASACEDGPVPVASALEASGVLPGDRTALERAVSADGPVKVRLMIMGGAVADRDRELDLYLERMGWPEADGLLVMVFPYDNYDVRFAMGTNFRKQGVTVAEMVHLLRAHHFTAVRKGDPAGGLAAFLQAVNSRMRSGPERKIATRYDAFKWLVLELNTGSGSGVAFDREPPVGEPVVRMSTSVAEARAFLGGAPIPLSLEGEPIYLFQELDPKGELVVAGVNVPSKEFYARYRPGGEHRVRVSFGDGFEVTLQERRIAGMDGRLVRMEAPETGKRYLQLWLDRGDWIYEIHDSAGNMERLMGLAAGLE